MPANGILVLKCQDPLEYGIRAITCFRHQYARVESGNISTNDSRSANAGFQSEVSVNWYLPVQMTRDYRQR